MLSSAIKFEASGRHPQTVAAPLRAGGGHGGCHARENGGLRGCPLLAVLRACRMLRADGASLYHVTEFGAVWMHRLQQLFSITYIDDLWERCGREAWPTEVVLA